VTVQSERQVSIWREGTSARRKVADRREAGQPQRVTQRQVRREPLGRVRERGFTRSRKRTGASEYVMGCPRRAFVVWMTPKRGDGAKRKRRLEEERVNV